MAGQPKLSDLTVLIADGNPHHRAIVSEILRPAGITRIFTAANSDDALQELRMWRPHVVILEWLLAPADGIDLVRRIRRGEPDVDRTVPIVMLTARNTVSDVEIARRAGVHEYAIKPVSAAALLTRVEAAVTRPRRFVDSPVYIGPCRRRKKGDLYLGPHRRLVDPARAEKQRAKAGETIARIAALTARFDAADSGQARALRDGAREAKLIAREINDLPLDRAADSLVRYLESMGAADRPDPEIAQAHAEALGRLIALPDTLAEARDQIARGLEALVQERMRQSAA